MSLKVELQARLLDHPEIEWKKSRFTKEEAFFVGGTREIAHFHKGNEIDVRLTRPEIRKRGYAKSKDSRLHLRSASTDWVEVRFPKESDLPFVQEIVESAARENLKELRKRR